MKYYMVCCQPRSGTHLLRRLMMSVDAGAPWEHFLFLPIEDNKNSKYIDSVETLYRRGVKNGVWGAAVHWQDYMPGMERLKKISGLEDAKDFEILNNLFPGIKFIYLYRLNKVKQAISLIKAYQSGMYTFSNQAKDFNFRYSKEEIERAILKLSKQEAKWLDFFEKYAVVPHFLSYESLCEDKAKTIGGILDFLDIKFEADESLEEHISKISLHRQQYDDISAEWYRHIVG